MRPWIFPVWCIGCGAPDDALCAACAPTPADAVISVVANTGVAACAEYDGIMRRAIVALKRGERAYLEPFARLLAGAVHADAALIPLPTSRGRRAARGFDQAVELARRVAELRDIPFCDVLEKRGAAQRGLSRLARLQADDRFRLRSGVVLPPAAVVVDDVCTTGATLTDAIATLGAAGVAVIGAAVLARAPLRNPRDAAAVLISGPPPLRGADRV